MADHAVDGDVFIYRGGEAPQHVINVLIDTSVGEIEDNAFYRCRNLVTVDTHDDIRKIGKRAFCGCISLRCINLTSVVEIGEQAFCGGCGDLESVEFGDRLETIGDGAFFQCYSLTHLKLPSIITIGDSAFYECKCLIDIELSERLETIEASVFRHCERLQRIAIPPKRDLFEFDVWQRYNQFDFCEQLVTVDLVGGIHKTVASLYMESWRTEMTAEINQINQVLPNIDRIEKTDAIRQWMELVLDKMDHYRAEHCRYVKEGITLLELALWKAKLGEKEDNCGEGKKTKRAKVDAEGARMERRVTCGADMVIKNVLPFLQLE